MTSFPFRKYIIQLHHGQFGLNFTFVAHVASGQSTSLTGEHTPLREQRLDRFHLASTFRRTSHMISGVKDERNHLHLVENFQIPRYSNFCTHKCGPLWQLMRSHLWANFPRGNCFKAEFLQNPEKPTECCSFNQYFNNDIDALALALY